MPADHACRTVTVADEMKRNECDECGGMKYVKGKGIPITGHVKAHGGYGCKGPHILSHGTRLR